MSPVSSSARQRWQGPGADGKAAREEHGGTWPSDSKATPGMPAPCAPQRRDRSFRDLVSRALGAVVSGVDGALRWPSSSAGVIAQAGQHLCLASRRRMLASVRFQLGENSTTKCGSKSHASCAACGLDCTLRHGLDRHGRSLLPAR